MATPEERANHAMMNVLSAIGVEMGLIGEGHEDSRYLNAIHRELDTELIMLHSRLAEFYDKHPFEPRRTDIS